MYSRSPTVQYDGPRSTAPLRLRRTVRRRVRLERRRSHPAAHVGRILSGTDYCARFLHMVRRRPNRNASTVGSHRSSPWLGRSAKDVGKQFGRLDTAAYLGRGGRSGRRPDDQIGLGHIQPGLKWTGDDADKPRIACRSATTEDQRSLARGARALWRRPAADPGRTSAGRRALARRSRRP